MKNIILFCISLMLSQQSYSQTAPAISGFGCGVVGRPDTGNFNTNLNTACEIACSRLASSQSAFEGFIFGEHSSSGAPICRNPMTGSFQFLRVDPQHFCLVDGGYEPALFDQNTGHYCPAVEDEATEDHGCTREKGVGNPCNVATGNKYQPETDFSNSALLFRRSYNSENLANLGLGAGWRHNFQRKLSVDGSTLIHITGNGRGESWSKIAGVWQGDADSDIAIVETSTGFELTRANNVVENYSNFGQLLSITDTNGQATSYIYNDNNQLEKVTNHYGSSVNFIYDEFSLSSVIDALGSEYRFEYYANGNLQSVIYPDTTPSDESDNPRRTYHYDDTNYPSHLTGITDENGDRYATWEYNADGKAILTKHAETSNAEGQETFELDYQAEVAQ